MRCVFQNAGGDLKRCIRCGRELHSPHPPEKCFAKCRKNGLGDIVSLWLSVFGIEKKPGCGCSKRQESLNQLGAKIGL